MVMSFLKVVGMIFWHYVVVQYTGIIIYKTQE